MSALHLVDDGVPEETVRLLRGAASARGLDCVVHDPRVEPAGAETETLPPGTLLYRPAVSVAAQRLEQALWAPGVATFHDDPAGPFAMLLNPPLLFARHGLPMPRSAPACADRAVTRAQVAALGGLPVVVKLHGHSGGIGTMRADSLPALFSLLDWLLARGEAPTLLAHVPQAQHWRVTVVGRRAVAAYRNPIEADDFRSRASADAADYTAEVPTDLAALAVQAVAVQRLGFGGVDILRHESGRLYLLEANFPCYFAQAQLVAGIDIAGAMVAELLARAASPP